MLADEDKFLHAVAVLLIPIAAKARVVGHELLQLWLRHGCIPLTGIAQANLFACLLENVANVGLFLEIADALGTNNALGPLAGYEFIEET